MSGDTGRARLASLNDEGIIGLIQVVPGLADSWAEVAGTDARQLERGHPEAIATLRAEAVTNGDRLLVSLATTGLEHIRVTLGVSEFGADDLAGPVALAVAMRDVFGSSAGSLLLAAVAAGGDPISAAVADRLAELQEIFRDPSLLVRPEASDEGETTWLAGLGQPGQVLAERTRELRELGAALAGELRAAAQEVELGRPVPRVGGDLIRWSAAVSQHLSDAAEIAAASDLAALAAKISELAARSRERDQPLQDAIRGARLLHEQGLDHLVPGMLKAAGFDTSDEWETVLSETAVKLPQPESKTESEDYTDRGNQPAGSARSATRQPAASAADVLRCPWDYGAPSLLASLISEQRSALAICVAVAADETPVRQRLLRFFCAAHSCSSAALELQLPDLTLRDSEVELMSADECRVLLAAALRVGLVIGYSPVDLPSLIERAEISNARIRVVAEAAAAAVQHGYRRETGTASVVPASAREFAAFGSEARQLQKSLAHRGINLQRASNVLRWVVQQDQPVGQVLALVTELAASGTSAKEMAQGDRWSRVERMAAELSDPAGRSRLITEADQAVSTRKQLLRPIMGGAWRKLDDSMCEVSELLTRFLAAHSRLQLSSTPADLQIVEVLFRAIDRLPANFEAYSVGDAALRQLTLWLRDATPSAEAAYVDELIRAELVPLYEIPRDENGWPTRLPSLTEVSELVTGRDSLTVVRGYLRTGNVAAAQSIIAASEHLDQAVLADEVLDGSREARAEHEQALEAVDRIAARLSAVYDDAAARELTMRAEPLRQAPDGRFDLTTSPLRRLADEGNARLRAFREELKKRALDWPSGEADGQHTHGLADEIVAEQFLTMTEADLALPTVGDQDHDDFSDFFPRMVDIAAAAQASADVVAAVRDAIDMPDNPANRQLAVGVDAWRELKRTKRAAPTDVFRRCVADVLRMLGLVPRPQNWLQELSEPRRSGYATFRVRAMPIDRSYVPSLGTQAHGNYDLILVWDSVTPARLLDFVDESRRTEANVILYFNTLDADQRLALRRLTSHDGGVGFSPVVVDEPVITWLSTRDEPGWRFTQRVTLPFTTINPYTPFALGEVPDEVFVGRAQERQAIESPTGSMFVYGGRQLGKSALLRRVERLFSDPRPPRQEGGAQPRSGRVAVYLDLRAASIGEAQEPAALWPVLAQRLRDVGVLPPRTGRRGDPDTVIAQLSVWLDADQGNRLLLLLDEADNFLTADSQANRSGSGAEFPTLQRLQGLMESSGRRFKAVFAGLHQVQRFHDSSNTPVAHGGDDILIGPLRSTDAYHLVVDPMNALGYTFASPELVWRLLLFTNYQASLVQIMCEALVRELSRRQLPPGGGRILITSEDVESVYARREVRDLIVQRFRWTINLDSRYRVIALVVALRSLDSDPGETFTPEELHEECEVAWSAGFSGGVLSSKEFRRYLEEMVGLGVLHRQGDQYGLRGPHIIGLLGTRQSISQELAEAPRQLELQYEYNPTMNRRIIGLSTDLGAPRSPLTDQDIASLLGLGGRRPGRVQIVTGSEALTVNRAAQVIMDAATEHRITCRQVRVEDVAGAIADDHSPLHLVVDMSGTQQAPYDVPALCATLASRHRATAIVIVGPAGLPITGDAIDQGDLTPIRRWSIEGLRCWDESPFSTPDLRARLHRVTSGWPLLVEATMRAITNGVSSEDALAQIVSRLGDPGFARQHLAACGIDPELAARWAAALALPGDDGLIEAFPASLAELSEVLPADVGELIERLQALDLVESTPDGWVLDRAVVAAAVALQE
jgi:hypothetical protein